MLTGVKKASGFTPPSDDVVRVTANKVEVRVPRGQGWLAPARALLSQGVVQGLSPAALAKRLEAQHGAPKADHWYPVDLSSLAPTQPKSMKPEPKPTEVTVQQGDGWYALARRVGPPGASTTEVARMACALAGVSDPAALNTTPFPYPPGKVLKLDASYRVVDPESHYQAPAPVNRSHPAVLTGGTTVEGWPTLGRLDASTSVENWKFAQKTLERFFNQPVDANRRQALVNGIREFASSTQLSELHAISLVDRQDLSPAQKARALLATHPDVPAPLAALPSIDRLGRQRAILEVGIMDTAFNGVPQGRFVTEFREVDPHSFGPDGKDVVFHGTQAENLLRRGLAHHVSVSRAQTLNYAHNVVHLQRMLDASSKPAVVSISIDLSRSVAEGAELRKLIAAHSDVCFVVAAGNESSRNQPHPYDDETGNFDLSDLPNVLLCASSNYRSGQPMLAPSSNRGDGVDLAQFGDLIPTKVGNDYKPFGGTSAATPQIANVVIQMKLVAPFLSVQEIRTILKATSVGAGLEIESQGLVDPTGAILAAEVQARIHRGEGPLRVLMEVAAAERLPVDGPLFQRIANAVGVQAPSM